MTRKRKNKTWTQASGSVEWRAQRSRSVMGAHGSKVHIQEAYFCSRVSSLVLSALLFLRSGENLKDGLVEVFWLVGKHVVTGSSDHLVGTNGPVKLEITLNFLSKANKITPTVIPTSGRVSLSAHPDLLSMLDREP